MPTIILEETHATLAELIEQLPPGEEASILRDGKPIATLKATALPDPLPIGVPILGRGKGKVLYMAPDFDDPIKDFDFEDLGL